MTIWPAGDVDDKLKTELKEFIEEWIRHEDYASRLPRQHIFVVPQGQKQNAGVNVILCTKAEGRNSWPYKIRQGQPYAGLEVIEEEFKLLILVKADKSSGGIESVTSLFSILRSLFTSGPETEERQDLISRGICNLFEAPEELDIDPGLEDEEGTFYAQGLELVCNTTTFRK